MKNRKIILKAACFTLIIALIFAAADPVLEVKYADGNYSMERFYKLEKNTVDVLFIGSSHAFETYNTSVLWDEYGIASYVLGGSAQPMWNTYYYLKEALKTQSPELIVLDAYGCIFSFDYSDYSRQIKNCYGMKPSFNKLSAFIASSSWDEPKFFFPLSNYASRYAELTKGDFLELQGNKKYADWMGFGSNYENEECPTPCIVPDGELAMTPKTEKYYRKILQLAKNEEIPIVVVITPYPGITETDAKIYNSAKKVAGEYDSRFEEFAYDPAKIGLDFSTDAADVMHLNMIGNKIYSEFFGNYLKENYTINDRRGDEKYQSWERCSSYLKEMDAVQYLSNITDFSQISLELKSNQNYILFVLTGSECDDEWLYELLTPLGMENINPGCAYLFNHNTTQIVNSTSEITYKDIYLKFHDDLVYSDRNQLANLYETNKNAVKIIVYDSLIDDVSDVFSIYELTNYDVYR